METYAPRRDQIEATMRRFKTDAEDARRICVANFVIWRDRPRKWKSIQTSFGTYVLVEDK